MGTESGIEETKRLEISVHALSGAASPQTMQIRAISLTLGLLNVQARCVIDETGTI